MSPRKWLSVVQAAAIGALLSGCLQPYERAPASDISDRGDERGADGDDYDAPDDAWDEGDDDPFEEEEQADPDPVPEGYELVAGSGVRASAIDLLFVPEGYRQEQLAEFAATVDDLTREMAAHADFASHWDRFDAWRYDVPSAEEQDPLADGAQNTAFGMEAGICGAASPDGDRLIQELQDGIEADVVVVIIRSDVYYDGCALGGAPGDLIVVHSLSGSSATWHELSHALPGLSDEYGACKTGDPEWDRPNEYVGINLSPTPDLDSLPWRDLVTDGAALPTPAIAGNANLVGAFIGPATQYCPELVEGHYRPQLECLMNLEDRLCVVCRGAWGGFFDAVEQHGCAPGRCGW